jgi:hypothetical protein
MKTNFTSVAVFIVLSTAVGCASSDRAASSKASTPHPSGELARTQAAMPRSDAVDAYVHSLRAGLSHGKVQIITDVMHLKTAEGATFWPIYQDYESDLFDLGDQRVELIRRFAAAQRAGKLSQDEASSLADGYFDFEARRVALLKKYHAIIAKELSPIRAAQFTQIEHRLGTVVDLTIAAEIPLIGVQNDASTAAAHSD